MNSARMSIVAVALALLLASAIAANVDVDVGQLAYVKNGKLGIWHPGSGKSKILADGLSADTAPQWSPDGRSILYCSPTVGPFGIRAVQLKIFPLAGTARPVSFDIDYEGTQTNRLAGVREIKQAGWYGPNKIYILGNIGPISDEIRVFDVATGAELEGFVGYGFSICRNEPSTFFYKNARRGSGYELAKDGVPVPVQPAAPLRLMASDPACKNWFGLALHGERSILSSFDSAGNYSASTLLPHSDYLRLDYSAGSLVLFRATGGMAMVDAMTLKEMPTNESGSAGIAGERLRQGRQFFPAYDWFPQ